MLETAQHPRVAHVHGPGGIGKTALLGELARDAASRGWRVAWIDGATLPVPRDAMLRTFAEALGVSVDRPAELAGVLANDVPRLLAIDGLEWIGDRDAWLRDVLLPELPASIPVAMAGRHPPSGEWTTDPGWARILETYELGPLTVEESRRYLRARGVDDEARDHIAQTSGGHPLALVVAADTLSQRSTERARLDEPDAIRTLLHHFVRDVPSDEHRLALQAACLLDHVTEDFLAAMVGDRAAALFEWLASLSFVSRRPRGLVVHDLVRELVGSELANRDRGRYRMLVARARDHIARRAPAAVGSEQKRLLANLGTLVMHVMPTEGLAQRTRAFGPLPRPPCVPASEVDESDWGEIERMVERHEGPDALPWVRRWRDRSTVSVIHQDGEIVAFSLGVHLDRLPDDLTEDPAMAPLAPVIERTLQRGRTVCAIRFWMTRDGHHGADARLGLVMRTFVDQFEETPCLGLLAAPLAGPERFAEAIRLSRLEFLPDARFTSGPHTFAWSGHELFDETAVSWQIQHQLQILRVVGPARPPEATAPDGFRKQVMTALRRLREGADLSGSPLVELHAVRENGATDRTRALERLLVQQCRMFDGSKRDRSVREAIVETYLRDEAVPQRELAARLGMPFGTYRRHLAEGIRRIADALWEREQVHGRDHRRGE